MLTHDEIKAMTDAPGWARSLREALIKKTWPDMEPISFAAMQKGAFAKAIEEALVKSHTDGIAQERERATPVNGAKRVNAHFPLHGLALVDIESGEVQYARSSYIGMKNLTALSNSLPDCFRIIPVLIRPAEPEQETRR